MTDSNKTATEQFLEWLGDTQVLIATHRRSHSGYYDQGCDGSIYDVIGSGMWPDNTVSAFAEDGFEAIWDIDEESCTVEGYGKVHDVYKAELRYFAYPLPAEWDGSSDPEFAECQLDFVEDDAVGVPIESEDAFQGWCEANNRGLSWLLIEEAHLVGSSATAPPQKREVLDIFCNTEALDKNSPRFIVLPMDPTYWGDSDIEVLEQDRADAIEALKDMGLKLIAEVDKVGTSEWKQLWGDEGCQGYSLGYYGPDTVYNRLDQDVTYRQMDMSIWELAEKGAALRG